jgi:hypothetical protein
MLTAGKAMAAGGAGGPGEVDFVASGSGSGTTVTYPSTVLAGDILLVSIHTYANTLATGPATPSGWTQIGFAAATPWYSSPAYRVMGALYYKVATGSEGASTAGFTFSADAGGTTYIVGMYRPTFSTASVTVGDLNQTSSTAAETITSGSATGYKGVISCFAWSTYAPPSFCTMSPTATLDVQVYSASGGQLLGVAFDQNAAVNATVTQGTGNFGVACVSCYLSLS